MICPILKEECKYEKCMWWCNRYNDCKISIAIDILEEVENKS